MSGSKGSADARPPACQQYFCVRGRVFKYSEPSNTSCALGTWHIADTGRQPNSLKKGNPTERGAVEKWESYFDRMFVQLEWWGGAAKRQHLRIDPFCASPVFLSNPGQRNAPPPGEEREQ